MRPRGDQYAPAFIRSARPSGRSSHSLRFFRSVPRLQRGSPMPERWWWLLQVNSFKLPRQVFDAPSSEVSGALQARRRRKFIRVLRVDFGLPLLMMVSLVIWTGSSILTPAIAQQGGACLFKGRPVALNSQFRNVKRSDLRSPVRFQMGNLLDRGTATCTCKAPPLVVQVGWVCG